LLASLSGKITPGQLSTKCIARLEGDAVEYIEEVEQLLAQDTDLGRLVAYHRVSELIDTSNVNPRTIKAIGAAIREDICIFEALLEGQAPEAVDSVQCLGGKAA
jgi:hypothetical protein